ncbi:hypothetical protein [Reticulibacter mediterranei]|nr:hypothetical protein [Reticulibacter mediterranei]
MLTRTASGGPQALHHPLLLEMLATHALAREMEKKFYAIEFAPNVGA